MFESLAVEIKELQALDPDGLTDDELRDAVLHLDRLSSSFDAARTALQVAFDARRVWADSGARSCSAFLSRETGRPKQECGGRLALGRALRHLPLVAVAWAAGDLSEAQVRRLVSLRNARTAEALRRHEAALIEQARTLSFPDFCQAIEYWRLHADPDGASQQDVDRRDRRRVTLDETLSGMRSGTILLDPVSGEIVGEELRRLEQELFEGEWAEVKARLGREPKVSELPRSPDQRRADALVEMAKRSATAPAEGKAPRPLFQVLLGSESLAHLLQLASGQVVSPTALLPWLDAADLERYLFEPLRERVISVSYRRTFTGALRDLIQVRDRRCFHRTCDVPATHCQVDHVEPWAAGGITAQENGRVACAFHNRARHRRRPPPRPPPG
jgi:hypothetical protein